MLGSRTEQCGWDNEPKEQESHWEALIISTGGTRSRSEDVEEDAGEALLSYLTPWLLICLHTLMLGS